jgi:hypothetical protein
MVILAEELFHTHTHRITYEHFEKLERAKDFIEKEIPYSFG